MHKQQHHIVAPVSTELAEEAQRVIAKLRAEGTSKDNKEALFQLVMKLTEEGVDFYFMEPLRRLGAGPVMQKMARMGLGSMLRATRMVVHNILKKINEEHMDGILDFIEEILQEPESQT